MNYVINWDKKCQCKRLDNSIHVLIAPIVFFQKIAQWWFNAFIQCIMLTMMTTMIVLPSDAQWGENDTRNAQLRTNTCLYPSHNHHQHLWHYNQRHHQHQQLWHYCHHHNFFTSCCIKSNCCVWHNKVTKIYFFQNLRK